MKVKEEGQGQKGGGKESGRAVKEGRRDQARGDTNPGLFPLDVGL